MAHFLFFSKKKWAAPGGIQTHISVSLDQCSTTKLLRQLSGGMYTAQHCGMLYNSETSVLCKAATSSLQPPTQVTCDITYLYLHLYWTATSLLQQEPISPAKHAKERPTTENSYVLNRKFDLSVTDHIGQLHLQ